VGQQGTQDSDGKEAVPVRDAGGAVQEYDKADEKEGGFKQGDEEDEEEEEPCPADEWCLIGTATVGEAVASVQQERGAQQGGSEQGEEEEEEEEEPCPVEEPSDRQERGAQQGGSEQGEEEEEEEPCPVEEPVTEWWCFIGTATTGEAVASVQQERGAQEGGSEQGEEEQEKCPVVLGGVNLHPSCCVSQQGSNRPAGGSAVMQTYPDSFKEVVQDPVKDKYPRVAKAAGLDIAAQSKGWFSVFSVAELL